MQKKSVAVISGGRSVEHRLSVESGESLCAALAGTPWDASLVVIGEDGGFPWKDPAARLAGFDYVFPLVHGAGFAGLLSLLDVPVLGEGAVGTAASTDKPLAKRVLEQAGLPVLPGLVLSRAQIAAHPREVAAKVAQVIGFPCFVKPASGAASVGASVSHDLHDLVASLVRAAAYDSRVMIEPCVDARDIEVGVLAGVPSIPGELVFRAEFHDHQTKTTPGAHELVLPAMVTAAERDQLQTMAAAAFAALDMESVARVEFLLDRNTHRFFVNEVNPLPCFAPTAIFPKLWEASGISVVGIVERLARAADAHAREEFRTQHRADARA